MPYRYPAIFKSAQPECFIRLFEQGNEVFLNEISRRANRLIECYQSLQTVQEFLESAKAYVGIPCCI
jgi:hypothetical protein